MQHGHKGKLLSSRSSYVLLHVLGTRIAIKLFFLSFEKSEKQLSYFWNLLPMSSLQNLLVGWIN